MILEIIPQAQVDLAEAAQYYNSQRLGLGDEFLAEFENSISRIAASPIAFEQVRPGFRRCLLNRFPYGIYYRTPDEHTVRVIIVRHHSRRPGYGIRRK